MSDQQRRAAFLAYFHEKLRGDRQRLIEKAGITKGRVTQLMNPAEPFGEKAARTLGEKLEPRDPLIFLRGVPQQMHPHEGGAPSAGIPLPAHAVSHLPFNDPPTFKWEDLLTIDPSDLPERFSVALPDNAMAPFARAGRIVWFRRATAVLKSGVCVLVKDAKGGLYFRRYRSYTADHWQAAPINESDYLPLDSQAHGLTLLAVMTHLESDGSEF